MIFCIPKEESPAPGYPPQYDISQEGSAASLPSLTGQAKVSLCRGQAELSSLDNESYCLNLLSIKPSSTCTSPARQRP